jgi:hypothetical protein
MNRLGRRGTRALFAAAAAMIVAATGAAGYWTGSGAGAGSAAAATTDELALSPGTPATEVYPGGAADVAVVATNPHSHALRIRSLALDTAAGNGGFAVDAGHSGCDTSALSFTSQNNGGSGWTVPAASGGTDGSLQIELDNALAMSAGAADACQGAEFTVHLEVGT